MASFHKVLGIREGVVVIEAADGLADRLRRAGERVREFEDGNIGVECDSTVIEKVNLELYKALMFAPTGQPLLVDNPHASGVGLGLRKALPMDARGRTFAAAHRALAPHVTGPAAPGPLGQPPASERIAKVAGGNAASEKIGAIHRQTDLRRSIQADNANSRHERNRRIRRAIAQTARSNYDDPNDARVAIRKALLAEGFTRDDLEAWGWHKLANPI